MLLVVFGFLLFLVESYCGSGVSGSPLTQMLVYASIFKCPNTINIEITQMLSDTPLDVKFLCHKKLRSPIELAIHLRRLDIVKLLIKSGAHPIDPCVPTGNKMVGIIQLFKEYYEFGTNHYITWLLHEYLLSDDLPEFIETVVNLGIFSKTVIDMFITMNRHPAHAILTCGHEEMIRKFVDYHGSNLLVIKNTTGKGSLQIAAERGDVESVRILVNM